MRINLRQRCEVGTEDNFMFSILSNWVEYKKERAEWEERERKTNI